MSGNSFKGMHCVWFKIIRQGARSPVLCPVLDYCPMIDYCPMSDYYTKGAMSSAMSGVRLLDDALCPVLDY